MPWIKRISSSISFTLKVLQPNCQKKLLLWKKLNTRGLVRLCKIKHTLWHRAMVLLKTHYTSPLIEERAYSHLLFCVQCKPKGIKEKMWKLQQLSRSKCESLHKHHLIQKSCNQRVKTRRWWTLLPDFHELFTKFTPLPVLTLKVSVGLITH